MYIDTKILNKILAKILVTSNTLNTSYTMIKWDSSEGYKDGTIYST